MNQKSNSSLAYYKHISKYNLLSKKEEIELSQRIENGDTVARNKMIQSNLRLVLFLAKPYIRSGFDFDDLVAEGNIGLIIAIEKYDWRKGFRFSTYASWWISQAINKYTSLMRDQIKTPAYAKNISFSSKEVIDSYIKKFGKAPSNSEIAKILGVSEKTTIAMLNGQPKVFSLNSAKYFMNDEEDNRSLEESLIDKDEFSQFDKIYRSELVKIIKDVYDSLKERDKLILNIRFGIIK